MTLLEQKHTQIRYFLNEPKDPRPILLEVYWIDRSAYLFLTKRSQNVIARSEMLKLGLNVDYGVRNEPVGISFLIGNNGVYLPELPISPDLRDRLVDKFVSIGIQVRSDEVSNELQLSTESKNQQIIDAFLNN